MSKCPRCLGTGKVQDPEEVGRELWRMRTHAELSIARVAEQMGIDPSYLSYLESGKREWSLDLYNRCVAAIKSLAKT